MTMADNTTTQTQTTATQASPATPAGSKTTSAAPTAAATPVSTDVDSLIEAAFAAQEGTETDPGQANRERVQAPAPNAQETDPNPQGEGEPEGEQPEGEQEPEGEEEADPNGDPEELTTESELEVPKGLENQPKWLQKRFSKFAEINRTLREENAAKSQPKIIIAPTPLNPLSDVESVGDLDARYAEAKRLKAWCEAHPDGETIHRNGQDLEITKDDVQTRLARVTSEIEAYPDAKVHLAERERSRPWESAAKVLPNMFKADTAEQKLAAQMLDICPEIATRFTDHELVMAALVTGMQVVQDKLSGKAIHVRQELGADGKPVPPKQKLASPSTPNTTAQTTKPKPPVTPQSTKPALRTQGNNSRTVADALASTKGKTSDERVDALLDAAFGSAA